VRWFSRRSTEAFIYRISRKGGAATPERKSQHGLDFETCTGLMGIFLPNKQRQHFSLHIQKDVLPYALCLLLCPVSAAVASIFQMDSTSTSYFRV